MLARPLNRSWLLVGLTVALAPSAVACKDPAQDAPAAEVAAVAAPPSAAPPSGGAPAQAATTQTPTAPTGAKVLALAKEKSSVGFTGSKLTGSHDGSFSDFSGSIEFVEADPTQSKVSLTIQMASLSTDTKKLTKHLKSADFFDVEKIPNAKFESTAVSAAAQGDATHTITGNLTLHGVTKAISVPATVTIDAKHVRAKSEFSINRKEFGIVYPGMPDDLIRDDVVVRFDLQAPRS